MTAARRRRVAAELRHVCPPPLGWRVIVRGSAQLDGDCGGTQRYEKSKTYVITVADDLDEGRLLDTLIHEWAHVLSWDQQQEFHPLGGVHDAVWGVWYARIFSAFYNVK